MGRSRIRAWVALVGALSAVAVVVACQSGDDNAQTDGGPDASLDDATTDVTDAASEPLPLPPMPSLQYLDGGVMTTANVVPIIYSGNTEASDIQTFLTTLGTSSYWSSVTAEYGAASSFTVGSPLIVNNPPTTIDDSQIGPWLSAQFQSDAGWPTPTVNDIYVIFYPATTTITYKLFGWTLCNNNLGYHTTIGTLPILYAVVPSCGPVTGRTTTALDSVTSIASHELIETVTDPLLSVGKYSWVTEDTLHGEWNFYPGSEAADMCAFQPQSYQRIVGNYVIQRSWSNASAAAGHDPCVPLLSTPYFNAIPLFTDTVVVKGVPPSGTAMVGGVKVPVGQSATIPVQFYSDGTTDDWAVKALNEPETSTALTFSWDADTGNNNTVRQLTITRASADTSGRGGTEFKLESIGLGATTGQTNIWWGFAGQ